MRTPTPTTAIATATTAFLVAFMAPRAEAAPPPELDWHDKLENGLAEAQRTGRAVLVVTSWAPGI